MAVGIDLVWICLKIVMSYMLFFLILNLFCSVGVICCWGYMFDLFDFV